MTIIHFFTFPTDSNNSVASLWLLLRRAHEANLDSQHDDQGERVLVDPEGGGGPVQVVPGQHHGAGLCPVGAGEVGPVGRQTLGDDGARGANPN